MYETHGLGETPETPEELKVKTTQNIITLVRAHQQHGVPIDYDGMMNGIIAQAGPDDPDVKEIGVLLKSLIETNPY